MEREFKAEAIIVRQFCEVEGCNGEMVRNGSVAFLTSPQQYPHACTLCGERKNFYDIYPMTKFRQVAEEAV